MPRDIESRTLPTQYWLGNVSELQKEIVGAIVSGKREAIRLQDLNEAV